MAKKYDMQLTDMQKQFVCENYDESLIGRFNKLICRAKPFEEEHGKEISAFSKNEICEYLTSLNATSTSNLESFASMLRKYMRYARANGIDGADKGEWDMLHKRDIANCVSREKHYFTMSDIDDYLSRLYNPADKWFILALFEGLCGKDREEIWGIALSDFDAENLTVATPNGKVKKVSQRLYDIAVESANTYTYQTLSQLRSVATVKLIEDRPYSVFKYSAVKSMNSSLARWNFRTTRRIKGLKNYLYEDELSIPRIINSGMYYQLQQIQVKYGCSFGQAFFKPEYKQLAYQYDVENLIPQYAWQIFEDFE